MFIIALLSCIALTYASFVPIVEPYHAPSYEIRHAVRDHLGERVREEVGNPAVGSFGHDGLVYPQYGLGYNRFGLRYGFNGPLFNRYGYGSAFWATVVFWEIMRTTMEFL
ncbi:hypothetical protein CEXT_780251 [Caerostris extrusa]|uniref:Uncharacterized protein n=1 Tax=Caerostris extrusa TaxID=172846 RepID=A0AAV4S728_CAEEX|nr:hypothetical protein CEXT_780251 [Caerostris extrusa]